MRSERSGAETGGNIPVRLITAAIAVALVVVLIVQNAQTVSINVLMWDFEARLIWALLAVALLGFLAGLVLPRFRR